MRRAAAILLAVVLLPAACGDDDSIFGSTSTVGGSTTTTAGSSTTAAGSTTSTGATTTTTAATTTATEATTTTTTLPPMPIITGQLEEVVRDGQAGCAGIEFSVDTPIVGGLADPVAARINDRIFQMISDRQERFYTDAYEGCDPIYAGDPASFFSLGFEATTARPGLLSMRFLGSDYYQGAAHPNAFVFTLNFNPTTGDLLALDSILLPGEVGTLATLVGDHILADLYGGDVDMYNSWVPGVAPDMLAAWVVSASGIEVSFDPYVVGPGAMGAPTVVVPWSELVGVVDPAGPAGPA